MLHIENNSTEQIAFLLMPGFSLFALACVSEPLRVANRLSGEELYDYSFLSLDGKPVQASSGAETSVSRALEDCPDTYRTIIVVAGFSPLEQCTTSTFATLRKMAAFGIQIGGIDTGSEILAAAGLLAGRRATIHWESRNSLAENFRDIEVAPELFVIDGGRMTSAGGTAGLDMMLHVIWDQHGHELATAVSEQFIHSEIRNSHDAQKMSLQRRLQTTNSRVIAAVELMEERKDQSCPISQISHDVGVSQRVLERLFKQELKTTPKRFYRRIRLERARRLLQQTDLSILEISIATGFSSAPAFSRVYKEHFATTPTNDRKLI